MVAIDDALSSLRSELDAGTASGARPATATQRSRGGFVDNNSGGESTGNRPTSTNTAMSANAGTFSTRTTRSNTVLFLDTSRTDPDDYNTAVGGEDFRLASATSTLQSLGSNKEQSLHKLHFFPERQHDVFKICGKHIGVGITSCIRENCTLNHRGPSEGKMNFMPGTIAVSKDKFSVYTSPVSNVADITDDILADWTSGSKRTLDTWTTLFRIAENVKETEGLVTIENFEKEQIYQEYANRYKSPRGGIVYDTIPGTKFASFKSITTTYNQNINSKKNEEDTFGEITPDFTCFSLSGTESIAEAVELLEVGLGSTQKVINKLAEKLDEKNSMISDELNIILSRTEMIESSIGERLSLQGRYLEAPTLWSSIALVTGAVDEFQGMVLQVPNAIEESREDITASFKVMEAALRKELVDATTLVKAQAAENHVLASENIQEIADSIKALARSVISMRREVNNLQSMSSINVGEHKDDNAKNQALEIAELRSMVQSSINRIDTLAEDRGSKAVKFFGYVLRNSTESNRWVTDNLDHDALGVIVDVHLVFEHIYHQTFAGDGVLKTLQGLYKVKIDTITQGLACSSFDYRVPRFFHTGAASTTTKTKKSNPNSSALDAISSWEEWDMSTTGYRTLLETQLTEFKNGHTMIMNDLLIPGTPAYTVAMLSVNSSTSWISALIAYTDRTYREFHDEAGFSSERAWFIVTRLIHRVFLEVSEPRVGVKKMLKLDGSFKTSQLIFWPMVQAHEIMKRFETASFKDDPCIAAECTKFILKNSMSDAIQAKVLLMESELKETTKNVKNATTSAQTASNVASEAKRLVAEMQKKVDKLK